MKNLGFTAARCIFQVHDDRMKNVTVYKAGDDNTVHPASYEDDIDILPDEEAICNGE